MGSAGDHFSTIIGKTIKGHTCCYVREVGRVGGKPKVISQRHLGKVVGIEAAMAGASVMPDRTRHLAFGDLAAVWPMFELLRVAEIIDEVVGSRRTDGAASIGTWIAVATANGVVDPCSKRKLSDRWKNTSGDRLVRLPASVLGHRRSWDAMDSIGKDQQQKIERRVVAHLVEVFSVDLSGLVLDMANSATHVDSSNDTAPIAKRDHAEQKRTDPRPVGLGLVVSTVGGIPLVRHAYGGNRPDVTELAVLVEELVARFGALAEGTGELTLVHDAGQDSGSNEELVEDSPFHLVGSLPPSDHPALLAVEKDRYRAVGATRFPGLTAFETRRVVFGAERRIVVSHSENLHAKQDRGFEHTLPKACRQLSALVARLARGKTRKSREKVEVEIAAMLKPRRLSPGDLHVAAGRVAGRATARLPHQGEGLRSPRRGAVRQADPPERRRRRFGRGDCGRLPFPGRGRGRLPPDEGPEGGRLLAHVSQDRPEDPGARLLLRAGSPGRPVDGPRGRPPRDAHEHAQAARGPGRQRRACAALPGPARAAARAPGAHRDRRHSAAPLRPLRSRRLCTARPSTPARPEQQRPPARTSRRHAITRKVPPGGQLAVQELLDQVERPDAVFVTNHS